MQKWSFINTAVNEVFLLFRPLVFHFEIYEFSVDERSEEE